ncbi:hypothetical protein GMMP15_1400001 [Candidatus Magnetomoraceae bacterium gMMP-15]
MLTNTKIEELITSPKKIIEAIPKKGIAADKKSAVIKKNGKVSKFNKKS